MTKCALAYRVDVGQVTPDEDARTIQFLFAMKAKVSFKLVNNHGVETFSWDATGEVGDTPKLISAMTKEIVWIQSKALNMKSKGLRIGLISATNIIQFRAQVFRDSWEDLGLEEVNARLKHIRLCTRKDTGWEAPDHSSHVELVVEAAMRSLD